MARFGLPAGTVPDGVDPTVTSWKLNATGWTLVLMAPAVLLAGTALGYAISKRPERRAALADIVG